MYVLACGEGERKKEKKEREEEILIAILANRIQAFLIFQHLLSHFTFILLYRFRGCTKCRQ